MEFLEAVVSAPGGWPEVTAGHSADSLGAKLGCTKTNGCLGTTGNHEYKLAPTSVSLSKLERKVTWGKGLSPSPWSCTAGWPRTLRNWRKTWKEQASWLRTNQLGKWLSNNTHKLHQCLAPFSDLQSVAAAASLMPSKNDTGFSLGNSNLEPHRKMNSGKCCFKLAELTQYKTILLSNAVTLCKLVFASHSGPSLLQSFADHPSFPPLPGCWQSAQIILLPPEGRHSCLH